MRILLTVSRTGQKQFSAQYQKVFDELSRQGVDVFATFKEFPGALDKVRALARASSERKYALDAVMRREIGRADAVVFEASYPSFRLGFEAFYAVTLLKPVLVLSTERDYSSLIDQPNFFGAKYNDFTLQDELEKFIKHVREYKLRCRFNLFISEAHKQKLDIGARKYGVSRSDYLRKLIDQDA